MDTDILSLLGTDTTTSGLARRSPYDTSSYNDSMYSNSPYSNSRYGSSLGSRYGGSTSGYGGYGSSYGSSYGSYGSGYGSSLNSYGSGYGSSYGGYGSSYGSGYGSGYGSSYGGMSEYGGGGYGGYGGGYGMNSYGGGGYGSDFGGQGQFGKYGPPAAGQSGFFQGAASQGFQFVNGFHSVTANVGRFAGLLDANSQAMHGALSSIVRLIENAGFLYREIGFALSGFTVVRLIQRLVRKILGRKSSSNALTTTSPGALNAVNEFQKENPSTPTRFWMTFLIAIVSCAFFGIPLLSRAIGKWLGPEEDEKTLNDAWGGTPPGSVVQVRAMHDYPAQSEHELSFRQGDTITVLNKPFEAWWEGEVVGQPGRSGLFPTNYTQPIAAPEAMAEPARA